MKRFTGALITVAFCACGSSKSENAGRTDAETTTTAAVGGNENATHTAAVPTDVTWTESPSLDAVPNGPIRGNASGRPFEGKTVIFEPGFESWKMIIADEELAKPTSILSTCRHLDLDLPSTPAAGKKLKKPMSYGGGYFQIDKPGEGGKMSWNALNAWTLEITDWKAEPWDPKGDVFQHAGTAAGRVIVMYESSRDDLENSWVAGTFDGAVVRYMGRPYWAAEKNTPVPRKK